MLQRVDSRTLAEYMALEFIDPHGPIRGDIQAGVIASTLANINRSNGGKPFTIEDFLPFNGDVPEKQQSEDSMRKQVQTLVQLSRGKM